MTPAERALRDAWIAEMWKPVPEYHPPVDPDVLRRAADADTGSSATITGEAAERGNAPRPLDPPSVLDYRKGDPW